MNTIVIDPGHGGRKKVGDSSPNNATGPTGTKEKDVALIIGLKLAQLLIAQGQTVLLTRDKDVNISLIDRAAIAKNVNAKVFVSIHFNGNIDPSIQGSETWVHSISTENSHLLAKSVQQRIVATTGYSDRGVKSKGLKVINPIYHSVDTASCLVEISFLTDPQEENRLKDINYINNIATALEIAINDYLNKSSSITLPIVKAEGDKNWNGDI